ncbi:MAG: hypothetical protein WBD20_26045 [Pirellulaceae bacterium]
MTKPTPQAARYYMDARTLFAGAIVLLAVNVASSQFPQNSAPNRTPPPLAVPASTGPTAAPATDLPSAWLSGNSISTSIPSEQAPLRPGTRLPVAQAGMTAPTDPDSSFFAGKTSPIARVGAAGEMIGFTSSDGSGSQTITLVHTGKSWMAVYHIDRSGTIRLVSSRPIDADFALQLNATSPLPDDIREMGQR